MRSLVVTLVFLFGISLSACNNNDVPAGDNRPATPAISLQIHKSLPHDTSSFTQGLEFYNGALLESTGNYGKSKLIRHDLVNGKILQQVALDKQFFGEGITVLRDTLYQLTYKENKVLVYTAKDFKKIKEFSISTEGWGITNDGNQLIVSDGSSNLFYYEPTNFTLTRQQPITEGGTPVVNINELEFIKGFVYANQWQYNYIIKIDPASGEVVGKIDLTDVVRQVKAKYPQADVLNGIAFNPENNKVYITGKLWPEMFEIEFPF